MQTRISHMLMLCLLLLAFFSTRLSAQTPEFPEDPGNLYIPSVIIIMGDTVDVSDTTTVDKVIDVLNDSTILYDTEENVLTLTNVELTAGDSTVTAISYEGSETLVIVLCDTSSILADTVITSQSDIIITGDGLLVAEGIVPIAGAPTATITFDSVSMYVRSVPSPQALRRRIRYGKKLDETGGPALSGFASADFNKTAITPPDAEYGEVKMEESDGGGTINCLYVVNENGEIDVLSEFELTAEDDNLEDALPNVKVRHALDLTQPMYNILGIQVGANYKGIVVQQGQTYLLK